MKLRPTGIALLAIGIPLTIYGVITYSNIVNEVNAGYCSLNPVSNLPKCEDATDCGAVFVVGLVVFAGGVGSLAMSRKRAAVTTAEVFVDWNVPRPVRARHYFTPDFNRGAEEMKRKNHLNYYSQAYRRFRY